MKVSEGGRVVIPVEIRRALGLKEGDTARLTTRRVKLRQAQALIERYCPKHPDESVVHEFIAERRAEAAKE